MPSTPPFFLKKYPLRILLLSPRSLPCVVEFIRDAAELFLVNIDLRAKMLVDCFHLDQLQ